MLTLKARCETSLLVSLMYVLISRSKGLLKLSVAGPSPRSFGGNLANKCFKCGVSFVLESLHSYGG